MNREPSLPDAFEITGGFRDIAVLGTESLEDWREFLKFVTGSFRTEFLVDLEPRHMPEDPALIFEQRESTPVLLRVFLDGIQLNCHFFGGDIELDLDPEEVWTQEDVDRVLGFLKELGDVLNRTVLLIEDGQIDWVYYRYEPHTPGPEAVDD